MKKRRALLRFANTVLFAATLLIGSGSLIPSQWLPGASLLSLAFPLLFGPHLLLLFINLRRRPKGALYNVAALALLIYPVLAQAPISKKPAASPDEVTLASYNVRAFYQMPHAADSIANWAEIAGIDILCLQEVRKTATGSLPQLFPYRTYAPKWSGYSVAIYSKYPILEAEPLVFETLERQNYSKVSAGYADILLPFDTVRILNVHLGSTGVRDGDMSVEPSREELLEAGQFVARKIAQSDKTRGLQGEEILDWIDKSPHPVILTGDFNGVPGGNLYARLLWKLHDPYVFHGYGTWGSFEPLSRRGLLFRIDWTLHDQTLSSTGQRIDNIPFSDHRPLITTFVPTLPEPEEE